MKTILQWRRLTLYALFAGCFYAFLMLCDDRPGSMLEFINVKIAALALMLLCGCPLCTLARKWREEGKIK